MIFGPLADAIKAKLGLTPTAAGQKVQFAAGIAYVEDNNTTSARIGDGDISDRADIEAGGFVILTSTVENRPDISASADT